ncbi:hypothetical protein [Microbacterium aerolatum]|uniref:hypothetical protein n=1 Tax=Microbacterium aerolatum TaxID=153731 RepID=UPI00384D6551
MDKYTASNGAEITFEHSRIDVRCSGVGQTTNHHLSHNETDAVREFFRAERDEELGRWRCPEIPDQVVYPSGEGCISLSETTGISKVYETRAEAAGDRSYLAPAARAYFEAHPERKPWHDAKPGEVWLLTIDGDECAAVADFLDFNGTNERGNFITFRHNDEDIEAGRRIWPESD